MRHVQHRLALLVLVGPRAGLDDFVADGDSIDTLGGDTRARLQPDTSNTSGWLRHRMAAAEAVVPDSRGVG